MTERPEGFSLSIVIPVLNEQDNIQALYDEISRHVKNIERKEIIFINDGSSDKTLERIKLLRERDKSVHYISFSRNFGHQNALKAGLDRCTGDIVISMDGDLQHPPRSYPCFDRLLAGRLRCGHYHAARQWGIKLFQKNDLPDLLPFTGKGFKH